MRVIQCLGQLPGCSQGIGWDHTHY